MRIFFLFLLFGLLPFTSAATAVDSKSTPTQADLIVELVDTLGWSYGLPDEPTIEDYIMILNGRRSWKYEIEDIYIPSAEAPLLPKEIRSFGPYSGQFWQRAPAREIKADFEFLVPLPGNYEIKAALTKPGYKLSIVDTELEADGTRNFKVVSFGTVELIAGRQKMQITIPPRGGIDYLLLETTPLPAIAPHSGWQPDKELTVYELANIISQTLHLQNCLVPLPQVISIEAEDAPPPVNAKLSKDRYQGPMQGTWVKAGIRSAPYSHLFELDQPGIYDLSLNILARTDVSGLVNNRDHFNISPKPYFSFVEAGPFFFDKGVNQVDIDLPPRAGLDRFTLKPRSCSAEDYLRLTGLAETKELTIDKLSSILQLLAAIKPPR